MSPAVSSTTASSMRIDAHHHFWIYSLEEYPWIDDSMAPLRKNFLAKDLAPLAQDAGIDGVVSVQARQSVEETKWLLQIAAESPLIKGVVGWAPLADEHIAAILEDLSSSPRLRGLRHVLQAEPDDFFSSAGFNQGLSLLKNRGLIYDLLVVERQLPAAIALVDRHPGQVFVLDHIAKPLIASGTLEPWRSQLRELAKRENVYCKLSGMVTEADWANWTSNDLEPYLSAALESFGPQRLMAGSDWPVCTVAASYERWFDTLRDALKHLSTDEANRIFGGTAVEAYRLQV